MQRLTRPTVLTLATADAHTSTTLIIIPISHGILCCQQLKPVVHPEIKLKQNTETVLGLFQPH